MKPENIFPKDFYWGASTASHQVEGGTENQWSVWELAHAQESAKTAADKYDWLPLWDDIKKQAENPENYVSGRAVDHYNKYEEDFDIAKKLNLNAFRFSIEWSRIEPHEGQWDEEEIEHYRKYIKELKKRGLEPFLNIWHWTMPTWFTDRGGFEKRSNIKHWERFVQKVSDEYSDLLKYVITINEPNIYMSSSYIVGEFPPGDQDALRALNVYLHLVTAHRRAYRILKAKKPSLQVGIAMQLANIQAKRPHNFFDQLATKWIRYSWNWFFLRRIRKEQDFIGFNYYFTDYYKGSFKKEPDAHLKDDQKDAAKSLPGIQRVNPKMPLSDTGWYMEPEGLYPLLMRTWVRYKKPIFVTENGLADMNDANRQWWIEETIVAMERAISEGVDLRGYMHWSLLDNFEWAYGWWPKFGLVEVDREHGMKRKIRPSAKWYAEKIKSLQ